MILDIEELGYLDFVINFGNEENFVWNCNRLR